MKDSTVSQEIKCTKNVFTLHICVNCCIVIICISLESSLVEQNMIIHKYCHNFAVVKSQEKFHRYRSYFCQFVINNDFIVILFRKGIMNERKIHEWVF